VTRYRDSEQLENLDQVISPSTGYYGESFFVDRRDSILAATIGREKL
jgi:hypothetical protein